MLTYAKPGLIAVLLLCAGQEVALEGLSCSNAPGYWNSLFFWTAADSQCSVKDLIGAPSPEKSSLEPNAIHILMFGDSNDRYIAHDQCMMNEPHSHGPTTIRHCQQGSVSISWQAMVRFRLCFIAVTPRRPHRPGSSAQVGVHPHGPWWGGETGAPLERLDHGFKAYSETYGDNLDVVTFSSNLWDLQRWATYQPESLVGGQLQEQLLVEWTAHLVESLTRIEVIPISRNFWKLPWCSPCFLCTSYSSCDCKVCRAWTPIACFKHNFCESCTSVCNALNASGSTWCCPSAGGPLLSTVGFAGHSVSNCRSMRNCNFSIDDFWMARMDALLACSIPLQLPIFRPTTATDPHPKFRIKSPLSTF